MFGVAGGVQMNNQLSRVSVPGGFSLIELLVVMGLLMTVGVVMVAVFLRTVRISGRNVVMERLEHQAGFAMERMVSVASEAKWVAIGGVDCRNSADPGEPVECSGGGCGLEVEMVTGKLVEFRCVDVGLSSGRIEEEVDGGGAVSLTDEKVQLTDCQIRCVKPSYFRQAMLTISFSLATGEGLTRAEERAETELTQTVVVGNM